MELEHVSLAEKHGEDANVSNGNQERNRNKVSPIID